MCRMFIELLIINSLFLFFTLPLIALALFNGLFPIYHTPVIFDFFKASPTAYFIITLGLFIFAVFMCWPVVTTVNEMDVLQPLLKIGYLILSLFLVSIACALIIFADEPIYEAFSSHGAWLQSLSICVPIGVLDGTSGSLSGPEMFSPMSTIDDQHLGGIVM